VPQGASLPGGWRAAAARLAPAGAVAAAMVAAGWRGIACENSMGNDEVATRWAAQLSLRELAHLLRHVDAVHGLYYLLMHGWTVLGTSPAVIRIPSVIAMVVACVLGSTLALLYAMEAEAAGPGPGAGDRRGGAGPALADLRRAGGPWRLPERNVAAGAGGARDHGRARPVRAANRGAVAAAAAGGVALTAPLLLLSLREHGAVGWINRPSLTDLRILVQDYFGANILVIVLLIGCAAAVVPSPRAWRETAWWRSGGISLPSVAVPLLVVPAAILIGESIIAVPLYVLYGEAGAALLAGGGCYRAGRWLRSTAGLRALIWVPGVIVCLCVLLLQLAPQHRVRTPGSRRYDYGGPSRYIAEHARPGDGILFFGKFYRKAELGYPADFRNTSDFAMAVSPLRAGDFQGRDKPFAITYPLMLDHRRIWVFGTRPSTRRPPA
jgi:mannosyltransferase